MMLRSSKSLRCPVELEAELEEANAEAAAMRAWLERHCPEAPILKVTSAGRDFLKRLEIAETGIPSSLVEGIYELRDSLALALSMVTLARTNRGMFGHLRGVLNRWGDVHLRLVYGGGDDGRGNGYGDRDGEARDGERSRAGRDA